MVAEVGTIKLGWSISLQGLKSLHMHFIALVLLTKGQIIRWNWRKRFMPVRIPVVDTSMFHERKQQYKETVGRVCAGIKTIIL